MSTLNKLRAKLGFQAVLGVLFSNLLIAPMIYGAPYPATGSSLLVAPEKGLFWSRYGFQLKTGQTGWLLGSPSQDDDSFVRYVRPNSSTGSLAIRMETLRTEMTLENYTKKWIRDYSNYGFDVLGSQTFALNGSKALVVDLFHKKSEQQMRQVLFLKNKKVVTLTCRDQQKTFEQTLIGCNQISKSFEWTDNLNSQKAF